MVDYFDVTKELEKLEQKILENAQKQSILEISGIYVRTAFKIKLVSEDFDKEIIEFYKKKEVEDEKKI